VPCTYGKKNPKPRRVKPGFLFMLFVDKELDQMAEPEKTPETTTEPEKAPETQEVIRADKKKNLRCQACGRHIADVTTNRAVVQSTCGRHDCKKINIFNIDGDEVTSKCFDKSHIVHF